jgi:hypothetical protein
MPYITTEAEVYVDLGDFDDDDLIEELDRRKLPVYGAQGSTSQIILSMYEYEKMGKDIGPLLRELYYTALGKII